MSITKTAFGTTKDGQEVTLYRMENASGAAVEILDYGARIRSIYVKDKKGATRDVVLGLNDLSSYENDDASVGAVVGRYANRIAKGRFTLNGKEYSLAINNPPNALHGGPTGFGQRVFKTKLQEDRLVMTYHSKDMEEGFPGDLDFTVTYGWSEDNELSILYEAAASGSDTIINFTNHAYFNLNGHDSGEVLNHTLCIEADKMTEFDDTQIPTGVISDIKGTVFDFTEAKPIGRDIHGEHPQMMDDTYDHSLVLNGSGFREVAVLKSEESGIRMTCFTDQPGIQIYVNDYVLHNKGKGNIDYQPFSAVCLETQHYPDSINHPEFPSVILKAGETFKSCTAYNFSVTE